MLIHLVQPEVEGRREFNMASTHTYYNGIKRKVKRAHESIGEVNGGEGGGGEADIGYGPSTSI